MQSRNFLLFMLTVLGGLALLTSCALEQGGYGPGVQQNLQIDLHVVGNPKKLKVITPGNPNCKARDPGNGNPVKGCIVVAYKDSASINFELKTPKQWRFTEIKICKNGTKATQVCELDAEQQKEFEASTPLGNGTLNPGANGVINLSSLSADLTEFNLKDHNSLAQDFFYTITVCKTGKGKSCLPTDPPIENKGGGSNH